MSISQDYLLPLLHQSSFIGPGAHSSGQLDQNYQAQMCVHSAVLYDKVLGQHYGHVFVKSLLFMFFCKMNCKAYFYSSDRKLANQHQRTCKAASICHLLNKGLLLELPFEVLCLKTTEYSYKHDYSLLLPILQCALLQ